MIHLLAWPVLPVELQSIHTRIQSNQHLLTNQDGYTADARYAGLWSWPEQSLDAERVSSSINYSLHPSQLHLQWVKPPGIGFHQDRIRRYRAVCSLTQDYPTVFKQGGKAYRFVIPQYHWALFDHTVPHAVLGLREDRWAVCIDFSSLYEQFTDLIAGATAGSLRSI